MSLLVLEYTRDTSDPGTHERHRRDSGLTDVPRPRPGVFGYEGSLLKVPRRSTPGSEVPPPQPGVPENLQSLCFPTFRPRRRGSTGVGEVDPKVEGKLGIH